MLATALGRIRGKLAYRPVVFELMPHLGQNGVYVFTGIPAPQDALPVQADAARIVDLNTDRNK